MGYRRKNKNFFLHASLNSTNAVLQSVRPARRARGRPHPANENNIAPSSDFRNRIRIENLHGAEPEPVERVSPPAGAAEGRRLATSLVAAAVLAEPSFAGGVRGGRGFAPAKAPLA